MIKEEIARSRDNSKTNDGKKRGSKFHRTNYSPVPVEFLGADGLRSSKNKKKTEGSTRSGAVKSHKSVSPRTNSQVQQKKTKKRGQEKRKESENQQTSHADISGEGEHEESQKSGIMINKWNQ